MHTCAWEVGAQPSHMHMGHGPEVTGAYLSLGSGGLAIIGTHCLFGGASLWLLKEPSLSTLALPTVKEAGGHLSSWPLTKGLTVPAKSSAPCQGFTSIKGFLDLSCMTVHHWGKLAFMLLPAYRVNKVEPWEAHMVPVPRTGGRRLCLLAKWLHMAAHTLAFLP